MITTTTRSERLHVLIIPVFGRILAPLAIAICCLMLAPAAFAQDAPPPPQPPADPVEYTQEDLDRIAHAYIDVQRIHQDYQARFAQLHDPEGVPALQDEMIADLTEAVEGHGLEVEFYDAVIMQAQTDEELQQALVTRIERLLMENQDQ
jgi:hypothetical protein